MCKVAKYLDESLVISGLNCETKEDLITVLCDIIHDVKGLDADKIKESIWEREQYGTTGIGSGVAIPHGRIKGIKEIVLVVATTSSKVDYDSVDGDGVKLVFMLIVPEGNNLVYLKLLSQISIICNDKTIRDRLTSASSANELVNVIRSID